MNTSIPKQFMTINGLTVIQYTMLAFERHGQISGIYVVASPLWQERVKDMAAGAGISKFCGCVDSGLTSFDSLRNGVAALDGNIGDETIVLVHDAVRPLVSERVISSNIDTCRTYGNAITAQTCQESFMVIGDKGHEQGNVSVESSDSYIPRESLLLAQTPHTFCLGELKLMMMQARERGIEKSQSLYTLANELGHTPLYAAYGESVNFKITYPTDMLIMQALLDETSLTTSDNDKKQRGEI